MQTIFVADAYRGAESVSLCVRMKSWLRLLNLNRRLSAIIPKFYGLS